MADVIMWRARPVLVTGATGLLGGHLIAALNQREASVVAIIRDYPSTITIGEFNHVHGDVIDQALTERVLAEYRIKTVFHLAAQTQVRVAIDSPIGTLDSNIRGTWSVLEACRRVPGVEQIIVASSDKAYGSKEGSYTEADPLNPEAPYDVSKACADLIARSYAKTYRMPICVTRCGNLFGPGDLNWERLIPGAARDMLRGEELFTLRSNGSPVRDYLYVKDAAEAYLCLAEAMANVGIKGEAFNISPGSPLTVHDVVQAVFGRSDRVKIDRNDAGEIPSQTLDSSAFKQATGWAPKYTFEQALAETIAWYRKYLEVPSAVS